MRVPLEWLRQYVSIDVDPTNLAEKLTMGGLEVEGIEESETGPVLDVYVTPNRGDCLSLTGVAREVAALYGSTLVMPAPSLSDSNAQARDRAPVTLEDAALCPRYAARIVRNVNVAPSPAWLQNRLEAAGHRPINNVVDVTNYVMLELGQPMHAFDLDRLAEGRIVVRRARADEPFKTLDGLDRKLTGSMLVIADAERPVAIAGIMGGSDSEVTDSSTNILLESAHFDPLSIRRTSRALGLRTEASYRFERVVDPDGVGRAINRAAELLEQIGAGSASSSTTDAYPHPAPRPEIRLRVARASELLGMPITSHICADSLRALGFEVLTEPEGAQDTLHVLVPTFRPDITLEEDLIEEVGRIYGYENIPETLPKGVTTPGSDSVESRYVMRIKRALVSCGLQEVVTHSLTAPSFFDSIEDAARRVPVRNALSAEISSLRRSLIPTLLDVVQQNAARGQQSLAIFEVGRIWQNEVEELGNADNLEGVEAKVVPSEYLAVAGLIAGAPYPAGWQKDAHPGAADFSSARGAVERLFSELRILDATFRPLDDRAASFPQFHPGRTATISLRGGHIDGIVGEIHPLAAQRVGLRDRIYVFEISLDALISASTSEVPRYRAVSRFPGVTRDLAPRVLEDVPFAAIDLAVREADARLLQEVRLTDVYRGEPLPEGIKSLTVSFSFRAPDRTLSESEVSESMASIRAQLVSRCGATFA